MCPRTLQTTGLGRKNSLQVFAPCTETAPAPRRTPAMRWPPSSPPSLPLPQEPKRCASQALYLLSFEVAGCATGSLRPFRHPSLRDEVLSLYPTISLARFLY